MKKKSRQFFPLGRVALLLTRSPSYHAVVHDFIPIFPGDNPEENGDSLASGGEVGMPAMRRRRKNLMMLQSCFVLCP